MKTKSVTLFYQATQQEVLPPSVRELERKDRWVKEVQEGVEADWKPLYIKVTYELHDPEIARQLRFFNGTVVKYYAMQNEDMVDTLPTSDLLKKYREEMLDELLGYDVHLVTRTIRNRKSTTSFRSVQAWNKFLNLTQETLFDSAGYEFPDSKEFWELVKEHGYENAERISIERLQAIMKSKLSSK